MSIIDSLKRLERLGDENSVTNQKLKEATTEVLDKIIDILYNIFKNERDDVYLSLPMTGGIKFKLEDKSISLGSLHYCKGFELSVESCFNFSKIIEKGLLDNIAKSIEDDKKLKEWSYDFALNNKIPPVEWSSNWVDSGVVSLKNHLDSFDFIMNKISSILFESTSSVIGRLYSTKLNISILKCHREFTGTCPSNTDVIQQIGRIYDVGIYLVPDYLVRSMESLNCNIHKDIVYTDNTMSKELLGRIRIIDYPPM